MALSLVSKSFYELIAGSDNCTTVWVEGYYTQYISIHYSNYMAFSVKHAQFYY